MAQAPDGSVLIITKFDTSGIKAGVADASKAYNDLAIKAHKLSDDINSTFAGANMAPQPDATQEYAEITAQIEKAEKDLNRAIEKKEKFLATGGDTTSKTYAGMQYEIENITRVLEEAREEKRELEKSGKINISGQNELDSIAQSAEVANEKVVKLVRELEELKARQKVLESAGVTEGYAEYDSNAKRIAEISEQLRQYSGQAKMATARTAGFQNQLSRVSRAAKSAKNSAGRLLSKLLKYTIGIRSLYVLFNKLRNSIKEGMKNLVQFDDQTNISISSISSSFTKLKNSVAAAFSPMLQDIAPAITSLTGRISAAFESFAMWLSAMSGNKTFVRAKDVQEDYAASLENTADAAKEAEHNLSSLDEIKTYSVSKSSIGYTSPTPQDMFEEVPISDEILQKVDSLKQTITEIRKEFKKGFGDAWKADTEQLIENLKEIQKSNQRVWSNPKLREAIEDLKQKASEAIGSISGGIESLHTSLYTGATGGIADALNDLEEFNVRKLTSISNDLKDIWTNMDKLGESIGTIGEAFEGEGFENLLYIYTKLTDATLLDSLEKLTGLIGDLWNFKIKPITENAEKIRDLLDNVFEFFSLVYKPLGKILDLVSDNSTDYNDTWFHKFMTSYIDFNSSNFGNALDKANDFFDVVNKRLENSYSSLGEWYNDVGQQIVRNMANGLAAKKNELINKAAELREQIKSIFASMPNWFEDKFADAWQKVKDVFSPGKNGTVFNGLKDGILESLKAIVNKLIEGINQVVRTPFDGLNDAFAALRDKSIAGIKPFGFLPNIDVPQIPYLAKGAVIPPNAPFAAVLGDQRHGTNIEAPLATIEDAVERVFARHENNNEKNNTYHFTAQIGRRTLFDEIITEAKLRQSATGRNPFELR